MIIWEFIIPVLTGDFFTQDRVTASVISSGLKEF